MARSRVKSRRNRRPSKARTRRVSKRRTRRASKRRSKGRRSLKRRVLRGGVQLTLEESNAIMDAVRASDPPPGSSPLTRNELAELKQGHRDLYRRLPDVTVSELSFLNSSDPGHYNRILRDKGGFKLVFVIEQDGPKPEFSSVSTSVPDLTLTNEGFYPRYEYFEIIVRLTDPTTFAVIRDTFDNIYTLYFHFFTPTSAPLGSVRRLLKKSSITKPKLKILEEVFSDRDNIEQIQRDNINFGMNSGVVKSRKGIRRMVEH